MAAEEGRSEFAWVPGERLISQESWFRVNVLSREIAVELGVAKEDIAWLTTVDFEEGITLDGFFAQLEKQVGKEAVGRIVIPDIYLLEDGGAPLDEGVAMYLTGDLVNLINNPDLGFSITDIQAGAAERWEDVSQAEEMASLETQEVEEGTVIIAVIDDGIAIGHELFTRSTGPLAGSRVQYYWNMDGEDTTPGGVAAGKDVVPFGQGLNKLGIDTALAANTHHGLLDDPAFYVDIGAVDWAKRRHTQVAHRMSHGTHVMGLCAGFDPDDVEGEKRPIIAVDLPEADVQDPSGILFESRVKLALKYIRQRVKSFVKPDGEHPAVVINFSFGNFAGPHDGRGRFERIFRKQLKKFSDDKIEARLVLADGNGNQSRVHARISIDGPAGHAELDWRVQPGDYSQSAVEFWLDDKGTVPVDYVSMTLAGPGPVGAVTINCDPLAPPVVLQYDGITIGTASFDPAPNPNRRGVFRVELFATDHPSDIGPFAPSGLWKFTFSTVHPHALVGLKAWVRRDETLPGFSEFGRQSYFDMASYSRYYEPGVDANPLDQRLIGGPLGYDPLNLPSPVRREGTLSGFTGGDKPIVVGAYVESTGRMALYSATGPTNNPGREGPDSSARGDDSPVAFGVLSAGSANGSMLPMPGTSMACPQVARWVADQLEAGQPGDRGDVCAAAQAMDPPAADKPPVIRTGCGRMFDLPNLYGKLRVKDPSTFWRT